MNRKRTVSHPENNASFLHSSFYLKAVSNRCSHRLLTQNIISLRSEGHDKLRMHTVLNGNDNRICQTPSARLDGLRRSLVELFPSFKHESAISGVSTCKARSCLRSRLRNCHHPAFVGFYQRIICVGLDVKLVRKSADVVGWKCMRRTLPLSPQPMIATVTGLACLASVSIVNAFHKTKGCLFAACTRDYIGFLV